MTTIKPTTETSCCVITVFSSKLAPSVRTQNEWDIILKRATTVDTVLENHCALLTK